MLHYWSLYLYIIDLFSVEYLYIIVRFAISQFIAVCRAGLKCSSGWSQALHWRGVWVLTVVNFLWRSTMLCSRMVAVALDSISLQIRSSFYLSLPTLSILLFRVNVVRTVEFSNWLKIFLLQLGMEMELKLMYHLALVAVGVSVMLEWHGWRGGCRDG